MLTTVSAQQQLSMRKMSDAKTVSIRHVNSCAKAHIKLILRPKVVEINYGNAKAPDNISGSSNCQLK